MQFWSILSTFRGTFGALLVWIQRSHLLSKGLRCQGGRTEFRKGSPSWQPCPKKDVNYMLFVLQRWGSKPVIVLTCFFGWRSSCTTAMMYQVLTQKNAQEMPLAIVAWHWRVASRWSGDDPGAGKLVATDWIGTRLLWGYWHLKKLEHVLTKKTLLQTYLQLPPAQNQKNPRKSCWNMNDIPPNMGIAWFWVWFCGCFVTYPTSSFKGMNIPRSARADR